MDGRRYMELVYYPTYARLDGLLCGIALAVLSVYRASLWQRLLRHPDVVALAGIITVVFAAWIFRDVLTFGACVFGFPLLSAGLALVVASATNPAGTLARLRLPGIGWVAATSYSLYLSHKAVLKLAANHLPDSLKHHGLLSFLCCALVALLVAALLHYLVERPFLRLRDRGRQRSTPLSPLEAGSAA
jgi:peptidoglycan/LPS O-acetylase OafA/YrhL